MRGCSEGGWEAGGAAGPGPGHGAFAGGIASLFLIWGGELGADRVMAAFLRHPSVVVREQTRGLGLQAAG